MIPRPDTALKQICVYTQKLTFSFHTYTHTYCRHTDSHVHIEATTFLMLRSFVNEGDGSRYTVQTFSEWAISQTAAECVQPSPGLITPFKIKQCMTSHMSICVRLSPPCFSRTLRFLKWTAKKTME